MTIAAFFYLNILFAHWVGDFVCQSDWMATQKSSNNQALSLHVLIYTLVLFVFLIPYLGFALQHGTLTAEVTHQVGQFLAANALIHFCIDFVTSRISSALYKANNRHDFFVIIGFDQFLHAATLIVTSVYIFGV